MFKRILRWLAVLPSAVLGAIVVMFPVHWVVLMIHYVFDPTSDFATTEDGRGLLQAMPIESLERFADALFVSGTFIAIGSRIAPRFRLVTAIVLTLLLLGLMSFASSRRVLVTHRFAS